MRQLTALVLVALPAVASAQAIDDFEFSVHIFQQMGKGFQSEAPMPNSPAGSERALIWEPQFHLRAADGGWIHDATVSVDIVSAASPDAIDAVSTASAVNEAVSLDVTSTYATDHSRPNLRYGFHIEEPYRSGWIGGGWARDLADGNATISLSGLVIGDTFDHIDHDGIRDGTSERLTASVNAAASQILSPTTLVDASYGLTFQRGTLETTWNSVPLADGRRGSEQFPGARLRNALSLRIAQHIPATGTTAKMAYRFYVDNYGLVAHTWEALGYQYLVPWIYLRGSYRYYVQSGVDFYNTMFAADVGPRTADSDLAPLSANEFGVKAVVLTDRSPVLWLRRGFFELSYFYYRRMTGPDLRVQLLGAAFGMNF